MTYWFIEIILLTCKSERVSGASESKREKRVDEHRRRFHGWAAAYIDDGDSGDADAVGLQVDIEAAWFFG